MIYLHQYPSAFGLPSLSPFCVKVETYLRMTKTRYQVVWEKNPRRGPKGKMPVIRDGQDIIPDSSFIIAHLKKKYGDLLDDARLSLRDAARAHAAQRLVEESLYFVMLFSRWVDPHHHAQTKQFFMPLFPKMLGPFMLAIIRRQLARQSFAQGYGRHSREEIYQIGEADLVAVENLFSDGEYFLGSLPHAVDASLFAFLETIRLTPIGPLQSVLLSRPRLVEYCARMRAAYFAK